MIVQKAVTAYLWTKKLPWVVKGSATTAIFPYFVMCSSKASAKCLTLYLLGCTSIKIYTRKAILQEFLKSLHPAEGCNPRGISSCENYYLLHPADNPMVQPHVEPFFGKAFLSNCKNYPDVSSWDRKSDVFLFACSDVCVSEGAKFRRRAFLYPV